MRIYRLLSSLVFIALLFSACQPTSATARVSFMVFGDPAELAAYQKLVNSFSQKYPNVQVELIQIPGQSDYRKRLSADIAAGNPADVVLINYRRYAGFAQAGALTPLGPYLEKSTLIKETDFYPQAILPYKWKGELMCIPQNISSLVVFYNKALFDQAGIDYPSAGWTWEEFLSAAQALTKDTDQDGNTDQFGAGISAELIRMAPFIWQAGGEIVDDESNPFQLMLDTEEAFTAGEFYFGLQTRDHVVPNAEQEASEDSEARFINGTLAMFFNSRRGVPTYRDSANFDWDVADLPQLQQPATILHSDAYCLPSASKNKDAAWTFIEYANSVEGQTVIAETGRTVPSLISVAESPAFLDPNSKPANSQVFLDVITSIRALPIHPNWAEIEDIATQELARGFYGETDVYDALLRAVQRTEEYFPVK